MKTCPLCGQKIESNQWVTAIFAARYIEKEGTQYDLQVAQQAILSHMGCPPPVAPAVVETQAVDIPAVDVKEPS